MALLGGACSSSPQGPTPPAGPNLDAVRLGREIWGQPASELGTAVRGLEAIVELARLEPAPSDRDGFPSPGREEAIAAIRASADAVQEIVDVDQPTATLALDNPHDGDVTLQAAGVAWQAALAAASDAVDAARAEADHLEALIAVEAGVAAVAKGWEEPGSRSQQQNRFRELVAEAQAHVATADALHDVPPCAGAAEARLAAALVVAERTAELRGYVDRGQGRSFDEARERFEADPWQVGLPSRDADDGTCWRTQSDVVRANAQVIDALDRLVEALNTGTGAPTEG